MKRLMLILLNVVMFLIISLPTNCQIDSQPTIYRIDDLEKAIINKNGEKWLADFYNILENGVNNPKYDEIMIKDIYGKSLKSLLEDDNLMFIINGWLYVFSYEPNAQKSPKDEDYSVNKTTERRVWLYRKNVKLNGAWELANLNEFATDVIVNGVHAKTFSFIPSSSWNNESIENYVIKSTAYKNVVFVLYGVKNTYNTYTYVTNQFIILTPIRENINGSIDFDFNEYFDTRHYPEKFTGQTNDGKTLLTLDNYGKPCKINTRLCKETNSKDTSTMHICFDSDYGSASY